MTQMNVHSLFIGSRQIAAYHDAISPCEIKRAKLVAADKKIRLTLRATAQETLDTPHKVVAMATNIYLKDHNTPNFELRFLWQGGLAYKTDVNPAHFPPQQSDLDVGVYICTSFLGRNDPALASSKMFAFVENALEPLCIKEGWKLIITKKLVSELK